MEKSFKCLHLSRKYSEKHQGEAELEEEAYQLITKAQPAEMERVIKGSIYEKFFLHLGPDLNIVCFCLNFPSNASLKQ